MNRSVANKAMTSISKSHSSFLQEKRPILPCQISYAIPRHLNSWNLADPRLTIDNYLNIKAEAHSFELKQTAKSCISQPDSSPVTTIRWVACLWSVWKTVMANYGIRNGPKNTNNVHLQEWLEIVYWRQWGFFYTETNPQNKCQTTTITKKNL